MKSKLPDIVFSEWKHWTERALLSLVDQPGVYVIAHFEKVPKGRANPLCQKVIYIGETCGNRTSRSPIAIALHSLC